MALYTAPLFLLAAVAVIIAFVKIRHSPISLKSFVAPIEAGINASLDGITAKIDDAQISLAEGGGFEIQLTNLQLSEADGDRVATAPLAAVEISIGSLLFLEVVPSRDSC